jgi:catechol 2,3-dioxygenase-like lactoylglutathione lyase family enzyme
MSSPYGISHVAVVTADLDLFRSFYEDTLGLETMIVLTAGPGHARQAIILAGDVMLQVFEVLGYDPSSRGYTSTMFERGRLDHVGLTVSDLAALTEVRDRLVAIGASEGDIRRLGPMLSVRFHDLEGFEGEVNCLDRGYDPTTLREGDQVVDPAWYGRITRALRANPDLPA